MLWSRDKVVVDTYNEKLQEESMESDLKKAQKVIITPFDPTAWHPLTDVEPFPEPPKRLFSDEEFYGKHRNFFQGM